jgi:hypothetical protein
MKIPPKGSFPFIVCDLVTGSGAIAAKSKKIQFTERNSYEAPAPLSFWAFAPGKLLCYPEINHKESS